MSATDFISDNDQILIVKAIENAELKTSGEIKVHLEPRCNRNALRRAAKVFRLLEMEKTQKRNGVLIYVAYKSCKFSIVGDRGINEVVPSDFWEEIKNGMEKSFGESKFAEGIINAIDATGDALRQYFPYEEGDVNERSNDISFGGDCHEK